MGFLYIFDRIFFFVKEICRCRDIKVAIATGYGLDDRGVGV
jgi:hypothetical protein